VLQGLSLPRLLSCLNLPEDRTEREEEKRAGDAITDVAILYLAAASRRDESPQRAVQQLVETYRKRGERFEIKGDAFGDNEKAQYMNQLVLLERELIDLQRKALIDLRDRGTISDAVLRRFQFLLDLDESRLEEDEARLK